MTWSITSRTDSTRRFDYAENGSWTAGPETTYTLSQPGYAFPLTPTGPVARIVDESTLFAAAWNTIPAPSEVGDCPPYPIFPSAPGVVY